jgi:phage-related protein
VVELVEDFDRDTYRAVYTVRFSEAVYVLHSFKKKSKQGVKTPQSDIDLIKRRLKDAEQDHAQRFKRERK